MSSFPTFVLHGLKPTTRECWMTLLGAIAPENKDCAEELLSLKPEQFRDPVLALEEETKQLPLAYLIDPKKISIGSVEWKVLACLESWARSACSGIRSASFRMPSTSMVTLTLADKTTIKVCFNTLVFQSEYFYKMLQGGMKESSTLTIECKDHSPAACRRVVRYLQLGDDHQYCYRTGGSVHCKWSEMDLETIFDMMLLADAWMLPLLKKRCEEWIAKEASFEVHKAPALLWKLPVKAFPLLGDLAFAVDYLQTVVGLESEKFLGEARIVVESKHNGWLSLPMCQRSDEKPTKEKINAFIGLNERYPDLVFTITGSFFGVDDDILTYFEKTR